MKTYYIITIGCQMNISDSERLARQLEKAGYKWTDDKFGADLVVVNTCGVKQSAENRIYGLIPKIKEKNPRVKIILTGCLVLRNDVKRRMEKYVDFWISIKDISNVKIRAFSKRANNGNPPFSPLVRGGNYKDYLSIVPKYNSKFSAFVPVGNGCNNFCTYCVVPYARGREVYRPADDVIKEVKGLVKKGYKEITLIAQNVNSYKSHNAYRVTRNGKSPHPPLSRGQIDFADLLNLVNDIPGNFWIRFATSHPKDMSDKLIKTIASCEKVCHHIHLPAQAGDNEILKKMNRGYKAVTYINLIKKIRRELNFQFSIFNFQINSEFKTKDAKALWKPPVAITTDIIVGFPGETKKQFENTAKLMREVKFDMAYLAGYSPRPGTAAAKLKDNVSKKEKARREKELNEILKKTALENNKKYIGETVEVLVDGKTKIGEWVGKTRTGKAVKIVTGANQRLPRRRDCSAPRNDNAAEKFVNVKIIKARDFGLEGVLMNHE